MFLKKVPNQFHFVVRQESISPLQHLRLNSPSSQGLQDFPLECGTFRSEYLFLRGRCDGQFLQDTPGNPVLTGKLQTADSRRKPVIVEMMHITWSLKDHSKQRILSIGGKAGQQLRGRIQNPGFQWWIKVQ
jgi:hypothetical protein